MHSTSKLPSPSLLGQATLLLLAPCGALFLLLRGGWDLLDRLPKTDFPWAFFTVSSLTLFVLMTFFYFLFSPDNG